MPSTHSVIGLGLLLASVFSSSNVLAQDCGKARKIALAIHKEAQKIADDIGCTYVNAQTGIPKPLCKMGASASRNAQAKLADAMKKFWNKKTKKDWKTLGPRELVFGKTKKGKLIGPIPRMFVSPGAALEDKVAITVKKTDGKGAAGVSVCATNRKTGEMKRLVTHTFPRGEKKKTWNYTVKNAAGRVILVHFLGKTVAREFSYSVRAEEK